MSLIGALNIGQSAMAVAQAQIQTTGNNIANAGSADYTRQVANTSPNQDQQIQQGIFIGTGVNLDSVTRQIDEALNSRIRASVSDDQAASTSEDWLSRVESTFNELTDQDLSTQLSTFFNSWSDLANKPQDIGLRQVVVQNGQTVAQSIQDLQGQLTSLQSDIDNQTKALTNSANSLAQQIADLNGQIVQAQGGSGGAANGLLDQRDGLLKQLAGLVDMKTVTKDDGVIDVYVGSQPLILGTDNRGMQFQQQSVNGELQTTVSCTETGGTFKISSGQLGALTDARQSTDDVLHQVDSLAGNIIFELNKIHSSGQGLNGFSSTSSTNLVNDPTLSLTDPTNGLKFAANTGSFVVHVTNKLTGLTSSTLVQVDLDGKNGNDTTLQSLAASIDGIGNISAAVSGGRLNITSDSSDVQFSFSQDTSGALASLGINSFFTGTKASDIAVNSAIQSDPSLLAAAQNGQPADNQTALAIANLETTSIASLNGATLEQTYQSMVNGVATSAAAAKTSADAASTVRQTLEAQRQALSGVSVNEEAVNLITQQRAFQGAARLISTVDEMMQTLMNIL